MDHSHFPNFCFPKAIEKNLFPLQFLFIVVFFKNIILIKIRLLTLGSLFDSLVMKSIKVWLKLARWRTGRQKVRHKSSNISARWAGQLKLVQIQIYKMAENKIIPKYNLLYYNYFKTWLLCFSTFLCNYSGKTEVK